MESNYSLLPSSLQHVGPGYQTILHPRLLVRGAEGGLNEEANIGSCPGPQSKKQGCHFQPLELRSERKGCRSGLLPCALASVCEKTKKKKSAERGAWPRSPEHQSSPSPRGPGKASAQSEGDKQNAHEVTKADSLNLKDKRHKVIWVFINCLLPKCSLYCPSFRYPPVPDKHGPPTTTPLTREDQECQ